MGEERKWSAWFLVLALSSFALSGSVYAQDEPPTPSEKTKEALHKLGQAPAGVEKGLEALKEAGKAALEQALGGKSSSRSKSPPDEFAVPQKRAQRSEAARFSSAGKRDPFRPLSLSTRTGSRPQENLSPLERYDLGQLKVVGIVWDVKEPRAMIEDTAGLGYIVKVGTPIGGNDGKVKAIKPNEVIIEEIYSDFHGARKKREVSMKLSAG